MSPVLDVKPTRSALIETKKKIKLARTGHKLLKMKKDGLIMEFFRVLKKAKDVRKKIARDYTQAYEKLSQTKSLDGSFAVRSAALAGSQEPKTSVQFKNVMGIPVPLVESTYALRKTGQRGYGVIGTTVRIDETASKYEILVEDVLMAAEIETTMRRLIEEIDKTKRRVNALEFKVIPELEQAEAMIKLRLEEMERENIFRLKKIKSKAQAS